MPTSPYLKEISKGIRLQVYVQPKASKSEIIGEHNGMLKVKIKAPPLEGKANQELVRFFSKILKIPKSNIEIIGGEHARQKSLLISGVSMTEFQQRIEK